MRKSTTTNTAATEEDIKIESSLRPKLIKEFFGQKKITDNLNVFVTAAKKKKRST